MAYVIIISIYIAYIISINHMSLAGSTVTEFMILALQSKMPDYPGHVVFRTELTSVMGSMRNRSFRAKGSE
jgi:uncharacterized membrane protein